MAVEKMKMISVVAPIEEIHRILQAILLEGKVHVLNYTKESSSNSLTMEVLSRYFPSQREQDSMRKYTFPRINFRDLEDKVNFLREVLSLPILPIKKIDRNYTPQAMMDRLNEVYKAITPIGQRLHSNHDEIKQMEDFLRATQYLEGLNISIGDLLKMKHFNFHLGTLTKERRQKLRDNYENIPAIVLHIGSSVDGESYLIFAMNGDEGENEKILKSLNFKDIKIPGVLEDLSRFENFGEMAQAVREDIENKQKEQVDLQEILKEIAEKYETEINQLYSQLIVEEKIEELKENIMVTDHFFCFSCWTPERDISSVSQSIEEACPAAVVNISDEHQVTENLIPPTKMRNDPVTRPFETMVNTYGTPNYKEVDPTFFLGITYLILFGAMFGDVGQGGVFFLAGVWVGRKKGTMSVYGAILRRLGIMSMIFGFLYGSIFGNEHVIPALLIRPLENVNYVLGASIIFGIVLLIISYGISIYNAYKIKDIEVGIFSRNGIVGLIFYIAFLCLGVGAFLGKPIIPFSVAGGICGACMIIMFFRGQIVAKITGKPMEIEGDKASFYIEGGFDIVETVIALFSNTLSFIRVGAFALNHVGLFLAFSSIADMMQSKAGSISMLVLGNIIIIFLEGLIVFIQGLRLEYYELFSKYFKGDGKSFVPVQFIDETEALS